MASFCSKYMVTVLAVLGVGTKCVTGGGGRANSSVV